ncbi:MAG: tripartite tricarboxylate transporter substrate binding protein [Propioniciclava sp.]|uniref:Bug family tripartite tricarboxylate transporter substrate binding protein n=1 Tax=Propioniciclava sp. TaxID=2038686 RepID=UPI0039E29F77
MDFGTTITSRRAFLGLAGSAAAFALTGCSVQGGANANTNTAAAVNYPTKPVEFVLPNSPGGSTDLIGRAVAKAWEPSLGQSLAIVNKPGANGMLGGKEALGRPADGYTLVELFQTLMAITPLTTKDSEAITIDQMDVIGGLTVEDYMFVVNGQRASEFPTLKDALAVNGLKYGTAGVGTGTQLAGAWLMAKSGARHVDVPFTGGSQSVTALMGNQVDAISCQLAEGMSQVKDGVFKPLCIYGRQRSEFLPEVPTAAELGYDVFVDQRRFVAGPKGMPDAVKAKLRQTLTEAFKNAEYGDYLKQNQFSRWEVDADAVVKQMTEAVAEAKRVVAENNIDLGG